MAANVRLDVHSHMVVIVLPCSKTDPAAASVERSWGRLCRSNGAAGCPFHCAQLQFTFLHKLFNDVESNSELPFFPTVHGETADKTRVVDTFEALHLSLGLSVLDDEGNKLLGGHSLRLAGTRLLSASGMH